MKTTRIALLFGGPSPERGISLNSARTVSDHLQGDGVEIVPLYFDQKCQPYLLAREWLYSNTPSDFDFKIQTAGRALTKRALRLELQKCDLAFPAMHGEFGEDGQIQQLLESVGIPYVGSDPQGCELAYDKGVAQELMRAHRLPHTHGIVANSPRAAERAFLSLGKSTAIIKPTRGGSSLGVQRASSAKEAHLIATKLLKNYLQLIVEPQLKGREFTVVVLQPVKGDSSPVALVPIEVETGGALFDFRRKYLATRQAVYHCPPRFNARTIKEIRRKAEHLFALFGLRDVARLDGWVTDDGQILFTDFNPLSGMEQNSFLFIQSARLGYTHRDILGLLVTRALARRSPRQARSLAAILWRKPTGTRIEIPILFGGDTAERQVSVLSGTNAWLKLTRSKKYAPKPFLLDTDRSVWELPYSCALNHTAEDITEACRRFTQGATLLESIKSEIIRRLGISGSAQVTSPRRLSMDRFLSKKKFVFLGLHGGFGEGGELQALLRKRGISFNGSRADAARLAMDKYQTGALLENRALPGVTTAPKIPIRSQLLLELSRSELGLVWSELKSQLGSVVLAKPKDDGCSAGVVVLRGVSDLAAYLNALSERLPRIEPGQLSKLLTPVELPLTIPEELLFEQYIITDRIEAHDSKLQLQRRSGWVELTVAVLGTRGRMRALPPSITVAQSGILSVEEKFQGGTGINLTPPPPSLISTKITRRIRKRIASVAKALGLEGYARIDTFANRKTGELIIIEANTLPALTPATVLFHQALADNPKRYPLELLEKIIELGMQEK